MYLTFLNQYIPPLVLPSHSLNPVLFLPADARIQRGYQRLSSSQGQGSQARAAADHYTGVLGQLMEKGQLSLDLIKANITELMAGGVDTVCVCVPNCFSMDLTLNVSVFSVDSSASAVCSV